MRRESMEEYLDISREIEIKKREVDPDSDRAVSIRIPSILHQFTMTKHKKTLGEIVAESHHNGLVSLSRDKFRLDKDIALSLFDFTTKSIIDHLQKLVSMPSISDCTAILMVGGFSESRVLQHRIKNAFSTLQVIIPQDARLAVMQGAVSFGFSPMYIRERIAKYTYGTAAVHDRTERCLHPPAQLYTFSDGITRCIGLFQVLVKEGSTLKLDSVVTESCGPNTPDQTIAYLPLFASEYPNAELVSDPGCRLIGNLYVPLDPKLFQSGRIYNASFRFGGTEIVVKVNNTITGEEFSTSVDFLG
ncbi:heat shock 70 kDa protein 12A-like [Mya arenaria]|nr:heat shock 70 kDa protein 12A-like [Mya arenaria]XP_052789970.1 heat shock 70 kDa protein 12A-like [Mya arenaria]XP_052789971.1 heat shock 70 kDa protein 12A-like [Mya arenaria]